MPKTVRDILSKLILPITGDYDKLTWIRKQHINDALSQIKALIPKKKNETSNTAFIERGYNKALQDTHISLFGEEDK